MKLSTYNQEGDLIGDRDYSVPIFEEGRGVAAVKFAIEAIQSNMRQGNVSTKTGGEVSGGLKKPFRQKEMGQAHQGSNRSPLMPGGGVVFGSHPRNFDKKVNKKVKTNWLWCGHSTIGPTGYRFRLWNILQTISVK
jgi:large subunit ribosomal protein L4